jgi:hypothetical protein
MRIEPNLEGVIHQIAMMHLHTNTNHKENFHNLQEKTQSPSELRRFLASIAR